MTTHPPPEHCMAPYSPHCGWHYHLKSLADCPVHSPAQGVGVGGQYTPVLD